MLNFGDSVLPYEDYKEDTSLMLPEAIELGRYDSYYPIADVVDKQTELVEFTGYEDFSVPTNEYGTNVVCLYIDAPKSHSKTKNNRGTGICNLLADPTDDVFASWTYATVDSYKVQNEKIYLIFVDKTIEQAKDYLKEQYAKGEPVQVAYELNSKTRTQTSKIKNFKYQAWKDGRETVVVGDQDEISEIKTVVVGQTNVLRRGVAQYETYEEANRVLDELNGEEV